MLWFNRLPYFRVRKTLLHCLQSLTRIKPRIQIGRLAWNRILRSYCYAQNQSYRDWHLRHPSRLTANRRASQAAKVCSHRCNEEIEPKAIIPWRVSYHDWRQKWNIQLYRPLTFNIWHTQQALRIQEVPARVSKNEPDVLSHLILDSIRLSRMWGPRLHAL